MKVSWVFAFGTAFFVLAVSNHAQTDDWPMFGHDSRRSNASSSIIRPPLREVARLALPDGYLYASGIQPPDFVVKSGKIFFGYSPVKRIPDFITHSQEIICLDANTGKSLWTRRLEGVGNEWFSLVPVGPIQSIDFVVGESLYVASQQGGFVAALNLISGNEVWRSRDEQVNGAQWMALARDTLVARSYSSLNGFALREGKLLWRRDIPSGGYQSMPVFTDSGVFFTGRSTLNRVNPTTGEPLWTTGIRENAIIQAATSSRVILSGTDTWPPRHATVSAFDTVSGNLTWNSELRGVTLMDLAASDAYIVAETINSFWDQSTVTCLETETGKTNWELTFVNTRPKSMVLAGNEYLYVLLSSADPERVASLSAVNIANGKIVWQQTFEISPLIYPSSQGSPPGLQTNYSRLKIADGKLLLLNAERSGERYANMLYVYEGAPPESSRGTFVYGRVIDADTMAVLLGISVEALQGGVVRGRAVTDAAGGFRMDGLAPGIYDLRASGINYSDSTEMALNIRGDDSLTVNFNLRSERRITQLASGLAGPGPLTVQGENIFLIENVIASETDFREVRVKRVPKAGGVATKLWAGGGDGGNAIRSDEVAGYFSIGSGVIYQIPLLGSATVRFVSANQPRDLQIDDGFIYWAESNGGPTDTTGIRRISKQGGSVSTLSTKGFEYALALDADSVYFGALEGRFISDPCRVTLMRSAKDGRSPLALWTGEFPNFLSANSINTIAVADGRVYWGGSKGGIRVTPTTGGTTSALVEGTSQISNLVIDDGRLFWIETDEAGSRWIKSIDIGTGKQELVATGQFNNFTLDGDFLYATTGKAWLTNGMLLKIAKKVGIRSTVLSGRVTEQPSGNPVAGAVVQVMQDGQIRRGKTTDESGAFRFADTAPGVYTLKTFKDGFISAIKSPVDLQAGENRELNFSLQVISTVPIDNKREVVIKREDGKNRSGVLGITIPTVPQKSYVLEYKDSLFDPFWRFLQSFLGEEALTTFLDTQANSVQRFYRFRIENINSVKFDYPLGPPYFSLGASLSPLRDNDGWYVEQDFGVANADAGGKRHLGEDWNSERGPNDDLNKPVFAAASGTVIYAESPAATWNGLIVIQHVAPQGKTFLLPSGETATEVWTAYGHLDPVRVEEWVDTGQRRSVVRNQQIGVIGPPPQGSSGPHLHFEVRTKNPTGIAGPGYSLDVSGWVDPSEFIELNRNER